MASRSTFFDSHWLLVMRLTPYVLANAGEVVRYAGGRKRRCAWCRMASGDLVSKPRRRQMEKLDSSKCRVTRNAGNTLDGRQIFEGTLSQCQHRCPALAECSGKPEAPPAILISA